MTNKSKCCDAEIKVSGQVGSPKYWCSKCFKECDDPYLSRHSGKGEKKCYGCGAIIPSHWLPRFCPDCFYKPSPQTKTEGWRKEFDEKFTKLGGRYGTNKYLITNGEEIKYFISQLLSSERQRVVEVLEGMKVAVLDSDVDNISLAYGRGFNSALSHAIEAIKKLG